MSELSACTIEGLCFAGDEFVWTNNGMALLRDASFEWRVKTWYPGEYGYANSLGITDSAADPTERIFWFVQEDSQGGWAKIGLRRSLSWLKARGSEEIGSRVQLDLPEMGTEGEFQLMAIDPVPDLGPGSGRRVTGIFQFSHGIVYNLRIRGQEQPIRGTSKHPYWSDDRQAWVPLDELRIGERLLVEGGTSIVLSVEESSEEPVYNLEVDADHCYRVGEQGVLVHNASETDLRRAGQANCAGGNSDCYPTCRDGLDVNDTAGTARAFFNAVCRGVAGVTLSNCVAYRVYEKFDRDDPREKDKPAIRYHCTVTKAGDTYSPPYSISVVCCFCCDGKMLGMDCHNPHWGQRGVGGSDAYPGCKEKP